MRHTGLLTLLAAVPLFVLSCSKSGVAPVEKETAPTVRLSDAWRLTMTESVFAGNGNLTVDADYSESTKSQLVMNGDGTHASVKWTQGDSFDMYDQDLNYTSYTASETGPRVSFSGGVELPGSGPYESVYPSSAIYGAGPYYGNIFWALVVPSVQDATAGSVAEEANISYARSATQTEDLHFKNVLSIIKFSLSGDIVSSVKKVKITGTTLMSGELLLTASSEGEPECLTGLTVGEDRYQEVSLEGDFVAGEDYYVAATPGYHSSFIMVFENSDGSRKITKYASNPLTLNSSRIADFGTIALGDSFDPLPASLIPYIEHTTSKYATIAVIPDGYTESEREKYEIDARAGIEALFGTEPYQSYRDYFNVWILWVASNESGARISDGTAKEQSRDCFFQSSWGKDTYSGMSANSTRVYHFVEDNCPDIVDGVHSIQEVPILLIINDNRYGGIAHISYDGSTYCMVPQAYDGAPLAWGYPSEEAASVTAEPGDTRAVTAEEFSAIGSNEGTWHNILVHEFGGHSIGRLGDEYWYDSYKAAVSEIETHSWPVPMSLNVSATSDAASVPWKQLFDPDVQAKMAGLSPLYAQRISVFQGAEVSMFYRWRSERVSCMIDNRLYFSTWQRYIIVNRIMTLAGLPALSVSEFLDNDDPTDPVRDIAVSPVMMPIGVSASVQPIKVPMLPPPVYVP